MRRRSAPRGALAGIFLLSAALAVPAQEVGSLTSAECEFVREYNSHYADHNVPFLVGHMAHTAEGCPTGINCTLPLAKRTKDFTVTVNGFDPAREAEKVFGNNLLYTFDFVSEFSGLDVSFGTFTEDAVNRIHIVFVDPSQPTMRLSADEERIAFFASRDDIPCLGLNFDWVNRSSEYSEVLIKTGLEAQVLANCLKEEIYNTSGVPGDPMEQSSLFSRTPYSGAQVGPPLFEEFSQREAIVMKLVYYPMMKTGQSRSETERIAGEIIEAQCK